MKIVTDDGTERRRRRAGRAVHPHRRSRWTATTAPTSSSPSYERRRVEVGRRRRVRRRRGLRLHLRPQEGHDHLGRRQHLSRPRSRRCSTSTRRCSTSRCSASPTTNGASACTRSCRRRPGETIDLDELARVRRARASPAYKRPRDYEVRDELPRTDVGQAAEARPARRVLAGPRPRGVMPDDRTRTLVRGTRRSRVARAATACPCSTSASADDADDAAVAAADAVGYPVVAKLVRRRDRAQDRARPRAARPRRRRRRARGAPTDLLAAAPPEDGDVDGARRADGPRATASSIAGLRPRPAVRAVRDARRRRRARRGARPTSRSASSRSTRLDADEMIDDLAHARRCSGAFRGEPAVDRDALADVLLGLSPRSPMAERPTSSSVDVNPLDRRRTAARSRSTRWSRSRRPRASLLDAERASDAAVRAARRRRRGRVEPPGQVRLRRAPQHPRGRLRGRGVRAPTSRAARCSASPVVDRRSTTCPTGAVRPRRSSARPPRQPRPAARVRAEGRPGRVPHVGRLRRGGRRRAARPRRELVALADELGIAARGPERPGRRVDAGARCARRSSRPYPPAGRHRDREPVGQLRVVVPELRRRRPASA